MSSHEGDGGDNVDEDEAAAAADFTPMTDEKRVFVNDWIAKLGTEALEVVEEQVPAACTVYKCLLCHTCLRFVQSCNDASIHISQKIFAQLPTSL